MSRLTTIALCLMVLPAMASADDAITGDAEAGEKVFRKCSVCHEVGPDAKTKVGPVLTGVVNRPVAARDDFEYSEVLLGFAAEGKVWTPAEMLAFLEKPRDYATGTKMVFAGLRKEDDRQNVIAYLATFSDEGS